VDPKAPVADLAAKVDRACVQAGIEAERRAFHPHITLARWNRAGREAAADFERRKSALASSPFPVTEFLLFESHLSRHGAHYEQVGAYILTTRNH
jgi:2'-5' RNA ligase